LNFDLNLISTISIYAPLIIGAFFYRRLSKLGFVLFIFVLISAIGETAVRVLYEFKVNNMFLFHFQSYLEFSFLSIIYYQLIQNSFSRKIIVGCVFLFLIGSFLFLAVDNIQEFNTGQRYLEGVLVILMITLHFRDFLHRTNEMNTQFIWLSFGYLIYFFGTLMLFLSQDKLVEIGDSRYWLVIHSIFNILLNGIISFVLWNSRRA